ncbi:hypothetical protein DCAR_0935055 [Daucus carota subsp. sativus]|uniref:DUF789 domain-containing protein n=1 Tax=Daucus carota subsp. sativus TaxID=79200 RepID=A0A175YHG5_DAUCS|nr:PREDICTED: uncharacterized protein LOC108203164 [Daucus carota subsp. sativus]WOH15514.1 hypothetical protein DCAR_0935055 [Daucus carota subsp. sativus]
MLGAGLNFGRRRGEERFYNPAKARSTRRGQLNQDHLRRALSDVTASQSKAASKEVEVVKEVVLEPVVSPLSNLERFLEAVIPCVPAQYPSKRMSKIRRSCDGELQPYFLLSDLWESFKEWSAYGAGVPLLLNDTESVVQYYVPYLSGMQLYVDRSKPSAEARRPGEDSDVEFSNFSSDGSSDYEHDRSCISYLREQRSYNNSTGELVQRVEGLSLPDQNIALQEGFSSDEGEPRKPQDFLLFEYLERDPPFGRGPLADKISNLALRFPELKSLRSCDLQPSSWISVAWYPIYRIPMGPTLKDLDACFLTFHHLSTPMTDNSSTVPAPAPVVTCPSEIDGIPRISLPIFGFASYKFKSSLWTDNGQLVSLLLQAADNWLTLRQVNHPDFSFFCRR